MHMKMRLYETPHWRRLMTGSLNPNTTSYLNDESLHLISDPQISINIRLLMVSPLIGHLAVAWTQDLMFSLPKSRERAIDRIFQWIAAEEEQILLMVFALRASPHLATPFSC